MELRGFLRVAHSTGVEKNGIVWVPGAHFENSKNENASKMLAGGGTNHSITCLYLYT
jgi:hypothetical protein